MKLSSIQLKHTCQFQQLDINFQVQSPAVTTILGDQAAGKTTILKNIYHALSWFPARFKDLRNAGIVMPDQDIQYNTQFSRLDVCIHVPQEIGSLPESSTAQTQSSQQCRWQLYKVRQRDSTTISKVEVAELERCVTLYHKALKQDPMLGIPMLAYYPSERFVHDINLLSKNNPSVLHVHSAFDFAAIPFTTFTRFFEWFREISDIENAQSALLLQQLFKEQLSEQQEEDQALLQHLKQLQFQQRSCLYILKQALNRIFPEITELYLEYHPKLQLMVRYQQRNLNYLQLSSSLKTWIALIGDVVRRLCLLNPTSIDPCQEGEGVLLIDHVDAYLNINHCSIILDRLHEVFPQLQIIVTGQQSALLDNAAQFQYFKLDSQRLSEIQCQQTWQQHQQLYDQIMQLEPITSTETLTHHFDEHSKAQVIFDQIQKLSPNEQDELQRLLQDDDDSPKEIKTY